MKIKRKLIFLFTMTILAGVIAYFFFIQTDVTKVYPEVTSRLFIPPLIDTREVESPIDLFIKNTEHEFFPGIKSQTKGFSQSYLGPTIRLYKNESVTINFINKIEDSTTIHGHGLHVKGDVDGGPQSKILSGKTKRVTLPIVQEAGMSWYHPHLMGKTAEHVHAGLAGLYIIDDENSLNLPLPKTYGVDDLPLVIQDRTFIEGKMKHYTINNDDWIDGLREETLVVNGTINPYQIVPAGWVRLRLLNGSNARFYRFFFTDNIPFYKIATEGGFLNAPVKITQLVMAPGERNEIMIDLSYIESIDLMAEFLPADPEVENTEIGEGFTEIPEFLNIFLPQSVQKVLKLETDSSLVTVGTLPEKMNDIIYYTDADKQKAVKRTLTLEMDMADDIGPINEDNMFSINGKHMNMNYINERVNKGDLELWTITAEMMPHPFHIHGVSFQILTLNGKSPAPEDRGWKDTVVVTGKPTEVIMRFNHTATDQYPYMYHCHILEHEDMGMMGQFTVQ